MDKTRTAALRMLSRRDHTAAELRRKLADADHDPEDINRVIDALRAAGAIDDRRVAEAYVRTASRVKGRGRLRIVQELQARGVDRALAEETAAAIPEDDETAAIERILSRKRVPARLDAGTRRRLFQQLLRRGFPAHLIARALKKSGHGQVE
jgi:regulatory protein